MVDFKTLRDNYLKQWHELEFHPAFETFVAPGSVKGYGVYDKISNTFPQNTKRFEIYVEPVGYDFKKIVKPDDYNHTEKILYSYQFSCSIKVVDNSNGNVVTQLMPQYTNESTATKNKITETYFILGIDIDTPFSAGEYTLTSVVTDLASRETFDIIKDIRLVD